MVRQKKKIIVDLDVITIGLWQKSDERRQEALRFIERIEKKEFIVIMLSSTLNLIEKWRHFELSKSIKDFYYKNTEHFIDDSEVMGFLNTNKVSASAIILDFSNSRIKQEDIMLILASVATNTDYLVTLNRKHLKNNSKKINDILYKHRLRNIKVVHPNEI